MNSASSSSWSLIFSQLDLVISGALKIKKLVSMQRNKVSHTFFQFVLRYILLRTLTSKFMKLKKEPKRPPQIPRITKNGKSFSSYGLELYYPNLIRPAFMTWTGSPFFSEERMFKQKVATLELKNIFQVKSKLQKELGLETS